MPNAAQHESKTNAVTFILQMTSFSVRLIDLQLLSSTQHVDVSIKKAYGAYNAIKETFTAYGEIQGRV